MLQSVVRDHITIRIVWRGGEVSELSVEPPVHALGALSRGAEMEARLLELARQGVDDAAIADILTHEGHRSVRRSYVPPRTVQLVRQRHRVLQNAMSTRARHIAGWLTLAKVAECLQVSSSWVKRRIRDGTIDIQRDPRDKRFLFPDTPDGIAALQDLKPAHETISLSTHGQTNEGINMTDRMTRPRQRSAPARHEGTMSEMELSVVRQRSIEAMRQKARCGELS